MVRLYSGFEYLVKILSLRQCYWTLWLKQVACGLVHGQGCGCEMHICGLANVYLDWPMFNRKLSTFSSRPQEVRTAGISNSSSHY